MAMRVAVVGAGPAGLTAAHRLTQAGAHVDVFEASGEVGGLARTLDLWGERIDIGSHIFGTHHPDVVQLWHEMLRGEYREVLARRGILTQHGLFEYPINPLAVFRGIGTLEAVRSLVSLVRARTAAPSTDPSSAEQLVVWRYGHRLHESFFRQYAEKLWGVPASEVDAAFASLLIGPAPAPLHTRLGSLLSSIGARANAAGGATFSYPDGGTGRVWDRMRSAIELRGGVIHLATPVESIRLCDGSVAGVQAGGAWHEVDRVVSTMPLTALLRALPDVPDAVRTQAAGLRFRNTLLVYLRVASTQLFPHLWLYLYDPMLRAGRVTNFRNWGRDVGATDAGTSTLAVEFWCWNDDLLWKSDDAAIAALAEAELRRTPLLGGSAVIDSHVVRMGSSHPAYDIGFHARTGAVHDFISTVGGLQTIGRHGAFTFDGVAESMRMGIDAATRALGDLAVNVGSAQSAPVSPQ